MSDDLFKCWRLPVTDGHELQVYEAGPEDGIRVLYLHGGPGSGFRTNRAEWFDLSRIHLVGFDQRGCGLSTPFGDLENNSTPKLVQDIEALRQKLGWDRFILCGSSWGSALAIEYAKAFPQHMAKLLLISTFLARQEDQDWSFEGPKMFFPEVYAVLTGTKPTGVALQDYLYTELTSGDSQREADAAYRFDYYGSTITSFEGHPPNREDIGGKDIIRARMLLHYAVNGFFLPDAVNGVLTGIEKLRDTPIAMIHGRYDMDCSPHAAMQIPSVLPHATLRFVMGNHSGTDAVYKAEIRRFTDIETA